MLTTTFARRFWTMLALIPALAVFAVMLRWPLTWTDQAFLSGLIIAVSILVGSINSSRFVTLALTMMSVFCTLRYGVWRWTSSVTYLQNSGWHVEWTGLAFAFLLLAAETYAITILLLGYFQSARPLKRKPVPLPADTSHWPSVDVFIPTYNEPLEVVRPTVLAALGIDWPQDRLNVYLLDDGRRPAFREFAEECGVGYIVRPDNKHAKAGNINHALKVTNSEYVAIFDCDHIATRSFLQVTMGWFFTDNRLAMVQTPHHFYSADPFERNLKVFRKIPNEGALFYGVVQDGNDLWNATFFCGSCAVIKRTALEEIGGIAVETVTEDAHTALRLQRRGWNTAYLGIPQAAGLATGSLSAHVGQRIRWARGMVQILRTECPLFASGLKFAQRLCYLNCVVHYLYAIPRLVFITAPLVYLIFGVSNLYGYIWEIVAYAAPHLVLSNIVNSRAQGDHRHSFWNEMYEMVLAPYILLPTTFALINPKWGKFNVTAKDSIVEDDYFDWKIARPYLFLLGLDMLGIVLATIHLINGNHSGVLVVNLFWAIINSLLLGASVSVCLETKQRRSHVRVEAPLTATLELANEEAHHCRVLDLSEGGLSLRAERTLPVGPQEKLIAILRAGDHAFRFPVEVVRTQENRLHLQFLGSDLKTQAAITKLVYARADSWLDWTKDQKRDRILGSLLTIFGIGANGLWLLPTLLIKRERRAAKRPNLAATAAKTAVLPVLLAVLLGLAPSVKAQIVSQAQHKETANRFTDVESFQDLGSQSPIVLRSDTSEALLDFVLPSTKIVDSATLALSYRAAHLPSHAHASLTVTLNDVEIGTASAEGSSDSQAATQMEIPADLLVHENALRFRMRVQCDENDPCTETGEAKSSIKIESSSALKMSGLAVALPNRLSMLPSPFFDPSSHRPIRLAVAFSSTPDSSALEAAGIMASWMGSKAEYRGNYDLVSFGHLPKGNVMVFTTADSEFARDLGVEHGASSVFLRDNPTDPYGKVLAFVGETSADLPSLARAIVTSPVLPSADQLDLQQAQEYPKNRSVLRQAASRRIDLTSNLNENLLHATPDAPVSIYFRLPPGLDFGTRPSVPLTLQLRTTGVSSDKGVSVDLSLNGVSVSQRILTTKDSDAAQMFAVPVSLLYPSNTLLIRVTATKPYIRTREAGHGDVEILPHSYLELGTPAHFVRMPRLDLFAAAGFPFTEEGDLSSTTFLVPTNPTAAQLGGFLDCLSFLGAQTRMAALHVQIDHTPGVPRPGNRNLIVIGSSSNETLFDPFDSQMIIKPAANDFVSGSFALPWNELLNRPWLGRAGQRQKLTGYLSSDTGGPTFLMEEFSNPFHAEGTVLILATKSPFDTQAYFPRMSIAANRGEINGGLVLADDAGFHPFQVAAHSYTLGNKDFFPVLYSWMSFHLWLMPLLLLASAFGVARWWQLYLERQASQRLAGAITLREVSVEN